MVKLNNKQIVVGRFPNGETYYDVDKRDVNFGNNRIELKFESNEDIATLIFIKDFIDEIAVGSRNTLLMKYIPYSRMDRVEENRLFTLKSLARVINSMNFAEVEVWEPHSDVSIALIDRVRVVKKSSELFHKSMMEVCGLLGDIWTSADSSDESIGFGLKNLYQHAEQDGVWVVYPDAGAEKRYAKQIKYPHVITASKQRDFNTGKIISFNLNIPSESTVPYDTAIIVDDLCSRGGTFAGCAEQLRKLGFREIILVVTHCENTFFDGDLPRTGIINKVVTTDSIVNSDYEHNAGLVDFNIM